MEIETGRKLKVTVEKLSLGGDGLARLDGLVLFIPYAAPGDDLEIEVTEKKKTFARARILQVLKPGPERVLPACHHYFFPSDGFYKKGSGPEPCGGCDFQHLNYKAQMAAKTESLRETLLKIGKVSPEILPAIGMVPQEQWRYRNKVQVPLSKDEKTGRVVAGFYAAGSHRIVPFRDCLIHSESMVSFIHFVTAKMEEWKLEPYSEKTHRGWLRHVLLRQEIKSGKMLATFVTASDAFEKKEDWTAWIRKVFPQVTGICQNINKEKTNVILGKTWRTIHGKPDLTEELESLKLRLKVSAGSFFQVNTRMGEKLYALVRDWAGKGELLLDLYCGVGGIALACAPNFKKILGAEENPSSVADAKENAALNGVTNCRFVCKDVRDFLSDFRPSTLNSQPSTVILDPPRSGCSPETLRRLLKCGPEKIIYVSCDPGTLARDLMFLARSGYPVKKVQPVDLFPQSSHVEAVALIEKK